MLDAPGVSRSLADERTRRLSDLRYALHLTIPRDRHQPIAGTIQLRFTLADCAAPLLLDFEPTRPDAVHGATINGVSVEPAHARGHLSFAADTLRAGENTVVIRFEAGDASLNRRDDLLYTLFVPARARGLSPASTSRTSRRAGR